MSAKDKQFLNGLFEQFLFDPTGAQYVVVKTPVRTVLPSAGRVEREGWLVKGKPGKPDRIYFLDGENMPLPTDEAFLKYAFRKLDFLAVCGHRLEPKNYPEPYVNVGQHPNFRRFPDANDLVTAAWLFKLGHDEPAARFLKRMARDVKVFREELAWNAYAGLIHAFMVRADDEAFMQGERLVRLYEPEAKKYDNAKLVLEDLLRRKRIGTFGKEPAKTWPKGFARWDFKKKVAYLIEALDEVEVRQPGQPAGVDLASDRRVQALIDIGDPAVPALIDVLEKDERLMRTVHYWRDFARIRTVLQVREAALVAIMSILRVQFLEVYTTGGNFTNAAEDKRKEIISRVRAYWNKFGKFPYDERMMAVLRDPASAPKALREAAYNLSRLGDKRTLATTMPEGPGPIPRKGPNPAVVKFKNPTAAEAILKAMERDLEANRFELFDTQKGIEDLYLAALKELGDERIKPVLEKRKKVGQEK